MPVSGLGRAQFLVPGQRSGPRGQRVVGHVEIDEAGPGDLHLGEERIFLQPVHDLLRDRARIGLGLFGGRQCAIALELAEIRPVRRLDLAQLGRKAFGRERGSRDRRQLCGKAGHGP